MRGNTLFLAMMRSFDTGCVGTCEWHFTPADVCVCVCGGGGGGGCLRQLAYTGSGL